MSVRKALLQTTMLVGIVGATFLSTRDSLAADLPLKAQPFSPSYAAVDGVNGKAGVLGGSLADRPIYAGKGSLSIPLGTSFGAQIDGIANVSKKRPIICARRPDPPMGLLAGSCSWDNRNLRTSL